MLAQVHTVGLLGLNAQPVTVEVDVSRALPAFAVVGLADTAVQESKERIRSAIRNSGSAFPNQRITINLAPADLRKKSPAFDLPMAIGILAASAQVELELLPQTLIVGELALNGDLRSVNGMLSIAMYAKKYKFQKLIVPKVNRDEASLVKDVEIFGVENLSQAILLLNGAKEKGYVATDEDRKVLLERRRGKEYLGSDFGQIRGQLAAKRALEIAASGGHNILFNGPPGSGKTMLAKALRSILPPMTLEEAVSVTQIYSVAGMLPQETPLVVERPFRTVHHTASGSALVGGGRVPRPGEISLAHKGVLFLDELAEFPADVLEVLRQPLEDRQISLSRAMGSHTYPASFTLIAAMNPCPCGYATDPEKECVCSENQILRYKNRISGPLLDRIDIFLEVPRLSFEAMVENEPENRETIEIRKKVQKAREIQQNRFQSKLSKTTTNAEMTNEEVKEFCVCDTEAQELIRNAVNEMKLSARAYFRLLKLARTISDLENKPQIQAVHIGEALQYRRRE